MRPMLLAGQWIESKETIKVHNPFDGSIVKEVAKAGPAELERATAAAVAAFETTRRLSSGARSSILAAASAGLARRKEEIARTISLEAGKPIKLARGEVDRAAHTFSTAADEARRIGGEVIPLDVTAATEGRLGITRRFPLGPVLAISPFNFPLNLVAHKLAPALAAGNPFVHKPASATPLTALLLGEILLDAGAPPAAVSVLPSSGADAERLVADDRFRVLTFTGSPEVGWALREKAGKKRVLLELGGNAAVVIHEDADLDRALERMVTGAFAYSGQVCISVQRIYVHEAVYLEFGRKLVERAKALKLGSPLDEAVDLGPMLDDAAAARVEAWVSEALRGGAKALCGARRDGRFYHPTVLENVAPSMKVHGCEIFGPVVNLYPYRDFEDALRQVNDSPFGLQAGVFTRDAGRIFRAFEALEVGGVIIDDAPTFRVDHMPYGGEKASGLGREGVKYAIEEMTQPRLLALRTR
ncbi:MAG TPA: aldehyde dehydrogenase family protein [Planctomycetota bacterium]|nr:aldehyde dehydrogenase family protein [Planctomycetota bacterium]